ncbi:hypothetical Protein YC6258_02294 [Gynuella sunshinyii YC6258]|uniref:Uncharacterized protein n=1 Tax=Gynuella sunshinyii YC6258 TaxID=1445510 RepID=A0A0C5VI49_9GAMM|nr:hypothetical Protein YC6258_02294 [Gynuella sunshinyii YC6258]
MQMNDRQPFCRTYDKHSTLSSDFDSHRAFHFIMIFTNSEVC